MLCPTPGQPCSLLTWATSQLPTPVQPAEVAALLVGLSVALWTYTTNGYDRDFTCARVWLWHSAVGVFSYLQITEEGRKGA